MDQGSNNAIFIKQKLTDIGGSVHRHKNIAGIFVRNSSSNLNGFRTKAQQR